MNLSATIQLHQGHGPIGVPDWTGTIEAFWADNPDLTYGDVRAIILDLDLTGRHLIGGGAAAAFTICTPAFARLAAAAKPKAEPVDIVERMADAMIELRCNGRIVDTVALEQCDFTKAEIDRHGREAHDRAIAKSRGALIDEAA